jgi:glycosyltransferase involved in cell wall biosynthesis
MDLSLVVPVYNEEENLPLLYQAVQDTMASLHLEWEIILVDDGSKDSSPSVLEELAVKDPLHVRALILRRNFGQTAAISAGIDHATGDVIIPLDADMQNDPADVPMLLDKINEGYDLVSGWRINRQDNLSRTLPSQMANWLISQVTGVHLHDYGCTMKAYRREVLSGFHLYGEMHRFIPVYAIAEGARMTEMPVHHHPRKFGKAKYGLERTLKVVLDLLTVKFLTSYAKKPIYLFGGAGFAMGGVGALLLIFLFIRRIFFLVSVFESPLFIMAIMISIMGFQSVLMGLIAELLARTYHESQDKLTYNVRQAINFKK